MYRFKETKAYFEKPLNLDEADSIEDKVTGTFLIVDNLLIIMWISNERLGDGNIGSLAFRFINRRLLM